MREHERDQERTMPTSWDLDGASVTLRCTRVQARTHTTAYEAIVPWPVSCCRWYSLGMAVPCPPHAHTTHPGSNLTVGVVLGPCWYAQPPLLQGVALVCHLRLRVGGVRLPYQRT